MWRWYFASRALCLLLLVPESGVLSDITYFDRLLAQAGPARALPEYPWPAVALLELPGRLGAAQGAAYYLALIALFFAIDAAFAALLWRAAGRRHSTGLAIWLALGPVLGPLVLTRFDSLAGAAIAAALLAIASRPALGGATAAFGVGIKLFPAVALPALLLPGPWRGRLRALGGMASMAALLVAATVAVGGVERLWSPFAFQAGRGLHVEAFPALPFLWARHLGLGTWESSLGACRCYELHGDGVALAQQIAGGALILALAGLALLYFRALRSDAAARTPALAARLTLLALLAFIGTNKVFSPQYLVWVAAPMAALALLDRDGLARADVALLLAACALTHVIFPLNYATLAHAGESRAWVLLVLLLRDALLVWLAARLAARVWRDTVSPPRAPAPG